MLSVSACIEFPTPEPSSNMEQSSRVGDQDIRLNETVEYSCKDNHWFEDQETRSNKSFELLCRPDDGEIDPPAVWPLCVPSKTFWNTPMSWCPNAFNLQFAAVLCQTPSENPANKIVYETSPVEPTYNYSEKIKYVPRTYFFVNLCLQ